MKHLFLLTVLVSCLSLACVGHQTDNHSANENNSYAAGQASEKPKTIIHPATGEILVQLKPSADEDAPALIEKELPLELQEQWPEKHLFLFRVQEQSPLTVQEVVEQLLKLDSVLHAEEHLTRTKKSR